MKNIQQRTQRNTNDRDMTIYLATPVYEVTSTCLIPLELP